MRQAIKRAIGAAMLWAAAGGAALASGPWTFKTLESGAAAETCEAGGEPCAALFCGRDGSLQFGVTGVDLPGDAVAGSVVALGRQSAGPFRFERDSAIGRPLWRFAAGATEDFANRLKRSTRLAVSLDGVARPLYFTLTGSRRAIDALEQDCSTRSLGATARPAAAASPSPAPAQTAPSRAEPLRSNPAAKGLYESQMLGLWGTRELCRTGAGWNFRRDGFVTPTAIDCAALAAQEGRPPAIKVVGQQCSRGGQAQEDVTYELSRVGGNLLVTRVAGANTATFILQRCG